MAFIAVGQVDDKKIMRFSPQKTWAKRHNQLIILNARLVLTDFLFGLRRCAHQKILHVAVC